MGIVVFIVIGVRVVAGVVVVVTSVASLLCSFLWFFDFIKFKLTLNFCNYLFGSIALFYFILQGNKSLEFSSHVIYL